LTALLLVLERRFIAPPDVSSYGIVTVEGSADHKNCCPNPFFTWAVVPISVGQTAGVSVHPMDFGGTSAFQPMAPATPEAAIHGA
jgi:hypothetical protein